MDLPDNESHIKVEKLPKSKKMQWADWKDVDKNEKLVTGKW